MAPINRLILTGALAALVAARPMNFPREPAPARVTETAWTTVNVPVTLWVDQNGTPLSTVADGRNFAHAPTSSVSNLAPAPTTSTTTSTTTTSSKTTVAESPKAPVETPSAPTTTTTTTTTTTPYVHTTSAVLVQKQAEPTATTTTPAAAPASSSPAAAAGGDTSVSASSSNSCEGSGTACEGDITHWDGGLGACGWNVNTESDMQIALPVGLMGSQSNGNPYCGRSLTIRNPTTGQTAQATVGDKCMGCAGRSIDLTNVLFAKIGGGCDGRCSGFEWWFD